MKILICIKQVPDMESRFKLNASGTWYSDQDLAWRMNEYDEFAVEQAIQLREQLGYAEVVVLSVGPDRVKEAMKKYKAVYFAAIGGAGALISKAIKKSEVIAYEELGAEALLRIDVADFPVIVINDIYGGDLYEEGKAKYRKS